MKKTIEKLRQLNQAHLENYVFIFVWLFMFLPKSWIIKGPGGGTGLDASCLLSVNIAFQNNLEFGTEYLNTYGPLAFLQTGFLFGISKSIFVLFHIFLVFVSGYIFYDIIFNKLENRSQKFIGFCVIVFLGPYYHYHYSLLFFVFFIFLLFKYVEGRNLFDIVTASIISVLIFYMKLNTGLILSFLLIVTAIYQLFKRELKFNHLCITIIINLSLLISGAYLLNTSIIEYVFGSKEIISGFNYGMFSKPRWNVLSIGLLTLAFYLIVGLYNFRKMQTTRNDFFFYIVNAFGIFILFKYGFVRGGPGHTFAYFTFITIFCLPYLTYTKLNKKIGYALYIPLMMLSIIGFSQSIKKNFSERNFFSNKLVIPYTFKNLHSRFINYEDSYARGIKMGNEKVGLDKSMIDYIGTGSVDVMGAEQSIILYNNLHYNPRPVIQSYSAYTPKLDNLNSEKYKSETRPDYILWDSFRSTDRRHPMWDEGQTKIAMLMNYKLASDGNVYLFEKRKSPLNESRNILRDSEIEFGKKASIDFRDDIVYLYAEIETTLLGKIVSFLYQPHKIEVEINYYDGSKSKYKAIPNILMNGVLINRKVTNLAEVKVFFDSVGKENIAVKSIKFNTGNNWFYKNIIKSKFEKISLK